MIILIIPLAEEFIFRRILLDSFRTKMPTLAAALLVIVLFAGIHVVPPVMLYILFLGSALTGMRLWYGNLWAPVIFHMCNNGFV